MTNKTGLNLNLQENNMLSILGISEKRSSELREWVFCEDMLFTGNKGELVNEFSKDVENANELAYVFYLYGQMNSPLPDSDMNQEELVTENEEN